MKKFIDNAIAVTVAYICISAIIFAIASCAPAPEMKPLPKVETIEAPSTPSDSSLIEIESKISEWADVFQDLDGYKFIVVSQKDSFYYFSISFFKNNIEKSYPYKTDGEYFMS